MSGGDHDRTVDGDGPWSAAGHGARFAAHNGDRATADPGDRLATAAVGSVVTGTGTDTGDDDNRADAAVCAALLHASRAWETLAAVALLLGAALSVWPAPRAGALILLTLLAAVERFMAFRIRLDARLFDRLADGGAGPAALARLDGALHRVLGVPAAKAGRPLAPRIAGAKRLAALHLAAVAVLVAFDLATILLWPSR